MEVILLEGVGKLGNVGDIVNVKNGYARNYLIPHNIALRATNENKADFQSRKAEIEKENKAKREAAEKEAAKIADKFVVLTRQAGEDGRLFGSVSSRDIATAVSALGVEVKRNQIALDKPIKYVGVYTERVALHSEVFVNINVNVARTADEAKEAEHDFLNPKTEDKKEEKPTKEDKKAKGKAKAEEAPKEEKPKAQAKTKEATKEEKPKAKKEKPAEKKEADK